MLFLRHRPHKTREGKGSILSYGKHVGRFLHQNTKRMQSLKLNMPSTDPVSEVHRSMLENRKSDGTEGQKMRSNDNRQMVKKTTGK